LKTVVVFDFTTNAWSSLPDMPSPRIDHGTVMTPDGQLVCAGGRDGGRTTITCSTLATVAAYAIDVFWTMERHCSTPSVLASLLSPPARAFVLFIMFVGGAMDRPADSPAACVTLFNSPAEAVASNASLADGGGGEAVAFCGVVVEALPPDVWLHILSFLRLTELGFAVSVAVEQGGGGGSCGGGGVAKPFTFNPKAKEFSFTPNAVPGAAARW
jgi:hypothetical protein